MCLVDAMKNLIVRVASPENLEGLATSETAMHLYIQGMPNFSLIAQAQGLD